MATLASRSPYPVPTLSASSMNSSHSYRVAAPTANGINGGHTANVFTSPTESEFSEAYHDTTIKDSVADWDEARVGDWLRTINCGQYIELFRRNNINGENLMDMDQVMLKEMGIKKIGDRVRIGAQAKVFRNTVYRRASQRSKNRVSTYVQETTWRRLC